jgi:chorismate synthase
MGIRIGAHIYMIAGCEDRKFDPLHPNLDDIATDFPVIDPLSGEEMKQRIHNAHTHGNSVGGMIECAITGLPAGLGEPMFGGVENRIAQIVYGIPAVKGVVFGDELTFAYDTGSETNDVFCQANSKIITASNHAGGILGGITTGMPVIFRTIMKPTPSIAIPQQTVNLKTGEATTLQVKGRHDPCIVPRAVPVVEAAAAIAIYDLILSNTKTERRK